MNRKLVYISREFTGRCCSPCRPPDASPCASFPSYPFNSMFSRRSHRMKKSWRATFKEDMSTMCLRETNICIQLQAGTQMWTRVLYSSRNSAFLRFYFRYFSDFSRLSAEFQKTGFTGENHFNLLLQNMNFLKVSTLTLLSKLCWAKPSIST